MHVCSYEQAEVDVPTADTEFTMSTNIAYSNKNVAYGTSMDLNDVSV